MPDENLTITLPFTGHQATVLAALLGLVLATVLVYLVLSAIGSKAERIWTPGKPKTTGKFWLDSLIVVFGPIFVALFLLAIGAGFTILWGVIGGPDLAQPGTAPDSPDSTTRLREGVNLGTGALIVALLSAPFVIWRSLVAQRTVDLAGETLLNEKLNAAAKDLAARRQVTRSIDSGGTEQILTEWQDDFVTHAAAIHRLEGLASEYPEHSPRIANMLSVYLRELPDVSRPNIEVRLNVILALERIAQDSTANDNGRDHVRVMEILCAYIRENAPASDAEHHPYGEWQPLKNDPTPKERAEHEERSKERFDELQSQTVGVRQWAATFKLPREDIAIALRVIGLRTPEQRKVEARWGTDAQPDADWVFDSPCPRLPDRQPGDPPLAQKVLDDFEPRLSEWDRLLWDYPGYRLNLRNTNLQKADLSELVLSGAHLRGARMEGAILRRARLEGAVLRRARMDGADLSGARMDGANLFRARMDGTDIQGARMEGAGLLKARIAWQTSSSAASFKAASLQEAALRDVTVPEDVLSREQIDSMFGDGSVTLPGIEPGGPGWPPHWPVWKLDYGRFDYEWKKWRDDPAGYTPPPPPDPPEESA